MISRHLLQSCLVAIMIAMAHAGSKSSKRGKGGSSGSRWNNQRPDSWNRPNKKPSNWNKPNKWNSPNSWSSSSKDYDDDKYYDDDKPNSRLPRCTLANPVNEQFDIISPSWQKAYTAAAISDDEVIVWHANLVMNEFMEVVEDYEYADFDEEHLFDMGEAVGDAHPTTNALKFTTDDQQDVLCAQTKALVLMMKDSCLYNRWKRTLEIAAYYYMEGFVEGISSGNFNLKKCVPEPKLRKNRDDE